MRPTTAGCDDRPMPWTVLIVDDHAGFRRFARRLLEADGFDVIGEAADGEAALVAADALRPELVLLDVLLPGIDGFAVAERLAGEHHPPAVVLTSSRSAHELGERLDRTTARGFIRKDDLTGVALARLAGLAS
jgi:DNA-binding NarL/FixJ family response regulator